MQALTAHHLDQIQTCPRKTIIERDWRLLREKPMTLFSRLLRTAILQLSNAADPEEVASTVTQAFLNTARNPGLDWDTGKEVYALVSDYCATLRMIIHYLARCPLLTIQPCRSVVLANGILYQPLAWIDESGVLHRWAFVDTIDRDSRWAEVHSWYVAGDTLATLHPMNLHMVAIGRTAGNRRSSPWCKAYADPIIRGKIRFRTADGGKLDARYKPLYFADNPDNSIDAWLDALLESGLPTEMVQHYHIPEPTKEQHAIFLRDLETEYRRIQALPKDFRQLPLSRHFCDHPPCPHQRLCYSQDSVEGSGLYARVDRSPSEQEGPWNNRTPSTSFT